MKVNKHKTTPTTKRTLPPFYNDRDTSNIAGGCNYSDDETEFIMAMQRYMKHNKVRYPAFTEVLAVARALGYRREGLSNGSKDIGKDDRGV